MSEFSVGAYIKDHLASIHDRISNTAVILGATGLLLGAAGCANPANNPVERPAANTDPGVSAAPNAEGPKLNLSVDQQYDSAASFITDLRTSSLHEPVSLPAEITDPQVRQSTLKAAEYDIASSAILDRSEENATEKTDLIQDPAIKAETKDGIARRTYADILLDLTSNPDSTSIPAKKEYLGQTLAEKPAELATYNAKIDGITALSRKAQAELRDPNAIEAWSKDHDELNKVWSDANADATKRWSEIDDKSNKAALAIYDRSPELVAANNKYKADYEREQHACDNLPSPEQDVCATDKAIPLANDGYNSLVDQWLPMIDDPTQVARIDEAMAGQANKLAADGYMSLYDQWLADMRDPVQKAKTEPAAADAAIKDLEQGYPSLADDWSDRVHNATDRARLDQANAEAAKRYYDQHYSSLGNARAEKIGDPLLRSAVVFSGRTSK